jgi:hypothetical protein
LEEETGRSLLKVSLEKELAISHLKKYVGWRGEINYDIL